MACDSLYAAWLKAYYPYEFYVTMLKLYTEKGNKEKVALIIKEMKLYLGIQISPGRFGEDNRDWLVNKETKTISQSLHSIKFISATAAEQLYQVGQKSYNSFVEVLYALQNETSLNTRQIQVLIKLGYFSAYGRTGKLTEVFDAYFNGKNKLTKTLCDKTKTKRMAELIAFENSIEDYDLPIEELVVAESTYVLRCMSHDRTLPENLYYIEELDDLYGVRIKMYNMRTGRSGIMRMTKRNYAGCGLKQGQFIYLDKWHKQDRYVYHNGKRTAIQGGKQDCYMDEFRIKTTAEGDNAA